MLLVNLAYCLQRPTGTTAYALNVLPHLQKLDLLYLAGQPLPGMAQERWVPISSQMTAEQGLLGHLRRLWWTQRQLPTLYTDKQASLLFSPLPEAPLDTPVASVVMVHDLIPLRFFKPWAPLRLYCQHYMPRVLAQAKHILCQSESTANDLLKFYNLSPQNISVIPLACDTHRFRVLDLPQSNYFLCLGRCAPYKNWSRVLQAFAQLPQRSEYEIWLAGPEDRTQFARLRQQAQHLGMASQVRFIAYPSPEEVVRLLNQAIALVFPSLWEGFGLPILEAMACGTPVITAQVSAMAEVAGDAALLVDPYKTDAITAAMQQVVTDAGTRSHLRRAGFQRLKQFSWAKTGAKTAEVLAQFL